jgi:diguanylate cyclase (GGDEF)-like protein
VADDLRRSTPRDGGHHLCVRLRGLSALQVGVLVVLGVLLGGIAVWSGLRVEAAMDRQAAAEGQYRELSEAAARVGDIQTRIQAASMAGRPAPPALVREFRAIADRIVWLAERGDETGGPREAPARAATAVYLKAALAMSDPAGRIDPGAVTLGGRMAPRVRAVFDEWQRHNADELDVARRDVRETVRLAGLALTGAFVVLLAAGLVVWRLIERTRMRAIGAFEASERRLGSLVRHGSDLVVVVGDDDGVVRYASPSCRTLTGGGQDPTGSPFMALVHPDDHHLAAHLLRCAAASTVPQRDTVRLGDEAAGWRAIELIGAGGGGDAAVGGVVLNGRDVTERTRMEAALVHQAFRDPLTGLANRALFENRLEHAARAAARTGRPMAMLLLDLDDFKTFNDSMGHATGDRILTEVGRRLAVALREADTAARLGGDEFAVLLAGLDDAPDLSRLAERVLASVERPMQIDGARICISCSVGVAVGCAGGESPHELMRAADMAMYAAKADGPGRWRMFEPRMRDSAETRLALRADLERAIERDELVVEYQPVVALRTGAIVGVEALVRWEHPRRGRVSPAEFIPLAEASGAIGRIGEWVLHRACADAAAWIAGGLDPAGFSLGVNVSPRQLEQDGFPSQVRAAIDARGIPARTLLLEVTEGVVMRDPEAMIARLHALRAQGVRIAVDDFGTGYSSLSYLARLPLDVVKIDRAFVNRIGRDEPSRGFARGVITLVGELPITSVAEGIEHAEQVELLQDLGCQLGQGFYFARPMPASALGALLVHERSEGAPSAAAARAVSRVR